MSEDDSEVWPGPRQTMDVHEEDGAFQPRATGVLDAHGRMIYRPAERIGFVLRPRPR